MADQIRINGNVFSWASLIVKVDAELFTGFTSINFGDKRERVFQYGMGRHHAPRGRTVGKYSTEETKLGGSRSSCQELIAYLASRAADQKSYGNVNFEISCQYVEPGSNETPIHVQLERNVIVGFNESPEESPDPMKAELAISTFLIRRNGLVLFDETGGTP